MMYRTCVFVNFFAFFDNKARLGLEFKITFLSPASCFVCLTFSVEQF